MMIIMNEREYIEDVIKNRDLGQRPYNTIKMIARYHYSIGYKPSAIRDELEHFLLRCDPDINLVKWSDNIDIAVSKAKNRPLVEVDGVPITKKEIEVCKSSGTSAYQRLAFTVLCIAKYYNEVFEDNNGWVNIDMKSIFSMANVSTSRKRQAFMVGKLANDGLVGLSARIDNTNIRVLFIDDSAEPALVIDEMRDLGFRFERFLYGEKDYPKCQFCGKIFRRIPGQTKPRKYCKSCAEEVNRIKTRENKRRATNAG